MKPTLATALSVAGVLAAGALAIAANTAVFAEPDMTPVSGVKAEDVDPASSVPVGPAGTITVETAGPDDDQATYQDDVDDSDEVDGSDDVGGSDDGHDGEAEDWDHGELDDD